MRSRFRLFRVIYLVVFIGLLAIAVPYVLRYINLINSLTGPQKK